MSSLFSINSPLWEMTDKLVRFLWLSILWTICSIPVVTMGASTTALYSVTLKYVRGEEGYLTSSFFRAFRENFRQSTIVWLLSLAAGLFLFADFVVYYRGDYKNMVSMALFILFMGVFVTFIFANLYVYPLLAYFNNSIRHTVYNALVMALSHPPSCIAMLTISFALLAIGMTFFPPLLFVAPGMAAYLHSRFLRWIFDQYLTQPEEA